MRVLAIDFVKVLIMLRFGSITGEMSRLSEFRVLCDCLSKIATGQEWHEACLENLDFSWATFIGLAHEYRVSSTIACAVRHAHASIPTAATAYLNGLTSHFRRRNEEIRNEAIKVATILNDIDVIPIFLKGGAHLLAGLYPDVAMRHMVDLDILVPAMRIEDCVAKLADHGITSTESYIHPRSHHCRPLSSNSLPVSIELHHSVLAYPNGDFLSSEELIASAIELDNYGVRIAVPSPACAVIHNIAHAQLNDHDYVYGRIDLRSLVDLALLSRAHRHKLDWSEISKRFVDSGWRYAWEYTAQWLRRLGGEIPGLESISTISRSLYLRALYHMRSPKMLSLNVRLLRVCILLGRELSDVGLRRRLAGNLVKADWWKRHLQFLFR
jgi:hypothetical protein